MIPNQLASFDEAGVPYVSDQGIIELAYRDCLSDAMFEWQNPSSRAQYESTAVMLDNWPFQPQSPDASNREWFTPEPYKSIDLRDYLLSRCSDSAQLARAELELDLVGRTGAEPIFRHLIYLVDTWRSQNQVWGVGRGSSVSCFLLYLIGLNKINPLDWDLDAAEFFKLK